MRLDPATCRRLLAEARVAHLATTGAAGPHIVPIVFAVEGDTIVSVVDDKPKTTRRLLRLRNLETDPRATVLVDRYDEDWSRLWWVRADGVATVSWDDAEVAEALPALRRRYPQYVDTEPPGPLIRITVQRMTGWAADPSATTP